MRDPEVYARLPPGPKRYLLGEQPQALLLAGGEGPVRAHNPPPRDIGGVLAGQHVAREAGRSGRDVAVGADEAFGYRPDGIEDALVSVLMRHRGR